MNQSTNPATTAAQQPERETPPSVGVDPGFLEPPADPSGYSIEYRDEQGNPLELTPDQAQVDSDIRGWAHTAGIPGTGLSALADLVQMPDEIQSPEECVSYLHAKWGGDFEEKLQPAREYVNSVEARKPGLKPVLLWPSDARERSVFTPDFGVCYSSRIRPVEPSHNEVCGCNNSVPTRLKTRLLVG